MAEDQGASIPPIYLNVALVVIGVLQVAYYYPKLPERMASHFGAAGAPNGWSSKTEFPFLMLGLEIGFAILFSFLGNLIRLFPDSMINLPNKERWLAPENREQTFAFFSNGFGWLGAALIAFLIYVGQLLIQINLNPGTTMNTLSIWVGLGALLTFVVCWIIWLALRFR